MSFKVLQGTKEEVEKQLNELDKDYNIFIVSSNSIIVSEYEKTNDNPAILSNNKVDKIKLSVIVNLHNKIKQYSGRSNRINDLTITSDI